ncbi:dynein axonemal intermediate chain 4 [Anastrepha obliqua]|uniref:dynein axonemal intermediate chain 4 n=1 Tax=Anastrepha obliqua TaxID=95512 RepID=UPI0024097819|nr:dynein axonemal intermediate chain 4 [Anastrepha obliqua]
MSRRTLAEKYKSAHISRVTYVSTLNQDIDYAIEQRKMLMLYDKINGKRVNVTPKLVEEEIYALDKVRLLHNFTVNELKELTSQRSVDSISNSRKSMSLLRGKSSTRLGMGVKVSLDDIVQAIGSKYVITKESGDKSREDLLPKPRARKLPFIKVVLRKTAEIFLFEQNSCTVAKGSEEAELVEQDNRVYEYLTAGRGKIRRRSEAETQTKDIFKITRTVNTTVKKNTESATYVSFFEMFDTYQKLLQLTSPTLTKEPSLMAINFNTGKFGKIVDNPKFSYAAMVLERILASNYYQDGQRRYRNMVVPSKMDKVAHYRYTLNLLYRLMEPTFEIGKGAKNRKAVSAISFCYGNGDLVAVGYGFYSHSAKVTVSSGNVCIWSMKNPHNPERTYAYHVPVTAVEFSPFLPFLIAVGLYDGSVKVLNITKPHGLPLAISQRNVLLSSEPVTAIQWSRGPHNESTEIDPFLVLTRDGKVAKFRIIPSPYLLGMRQMELNRIVGNPEGLQKQSVNITMQGKYESNRHPCGLNLVLHPFESDLYFILTDEGCIQKCSLNHTHSYLEALKVHEGSVNHMDFSPWSPKLFLTCGNDWTIRIWLEGIFQPLITLCSRFAPVHCAMWSRTHSTVIIAINRETIDIWDLRRNILMPVSSQHVDRSFQTLGKLSLCGRSLAVGNERGNLLMFSFEDMPFQPYAQYKELEKAIYKAIETSPTLINELKNIGYFGYGKKKNKNF